MTTFEYLMQLKVWCSTGCSSPQLLVVDVVWFSCYIEYFSQLALFCFAKTAMKLINSLFYHGNPLIFKILNAYVEERLKLVFSFTGLFSFYVTTWNNFLILSSFSCLFLSFLLLQRNTIIISFIPPFRFKPHSVKIWRNGRFSPNTFVLFHYLFVSE